MNNGGGNRPGQQGNTNTGPPLPGRSGQPPPPRGFSGGSYSQYQSNGSRPHQAIPYSHEEEEEIQQKLNKVLGPEYVSFRPGGNGGNVSYIEGWKALNLANDIFGFNGWSSELIGVQVDFLDVMPNRKVNLGLSVVVRITIKDGTFHEDFGYGFIENAKSKATAFEKCKKEAYTDGLKRCLRCFGNVLGNCLYDKTIIAKMQKVKQPPRELEHGDFHRDPLVLNRELEKEKKAAVKREAEMKAIAPPPPPPESIQAESAARKNDANGPGSNTNTDNARGPQVINNIDLGDFDDLFQFSDDIPGEELNDRLDEYEVELLKNKENEQKASDEPQLKSETPQPTPSQVFFTSSKKALDIQNVSDQSNVPVYDHKFVSNNLRRTIDPSKSTKVRRSNVPSALPGSQSLVTTPSPASGKRPLGLPSSQRNQFKRPHMENNEKESPGNDTPGK